MEKKEMMDGWVVFGVMYNLNFEAPTVELSIVCRLDSLFHCEAKHRV